MKTKTIKQTVTLNAAPDKVYNTLMDSKKHAALTGSKASMSKKPGGNFSVFDGYCHGYNLELIESQKIKQAWHFAEDGWPDNYYSICTFSFEDLGGKTKLTFIQTGVPEHKADDLKNGWKQFYWEPLKALFKKK